MTRVIEINSEADLAKLAGTGSSGRPKRQYLRAPVRPRSPLIPHLLAWTTGRDAENAALRARYHAETTGAPADYEAAADAFDALGYTAGKVLRALASRRRAGDQVHLHVTADGVYHVREGRRP